MSNILAITYERAVTVTKSDTVADPSGPFAALIVTVAGTLKFTAVNGGDVALGSTTVGQIIPIATSRVWSTGTGATVMGLLAMPYKGVASS